MIYSLGVDRGGGQGRLCRAQLRGGEALWGAEGALLSVRTGEAGQGWGRGGGCGGEQKSRHSKGLLCLPPGTIITSAVLVWPGHFQEKSESQILCEISSF